MSLRFPYLRLRAKNAVATLGGALYRPRPIIPVTIIGPATSHVLPSLIDPGSDDVAFPEQLAISLGIDLGRCPTIRSIGVGGPPCVLRLANVVLRIADNKERREWSALVGFTSANLRYGLLGYAGFLQYFTATFHGEREEVELTVNASYPGT